MLLQQAFHNYAHIIQHIMWLFEVVGVYVKLLFIVFYSAANISWILFIIQIYFLSRLIL